MTRYHRRHWALAGSLAALAGYVDAIGFLQLGGFFVSFMSGNSTRLAVGLVTNAAAARLAGGLVAAFLVGTIAGALIAAAAGARRKPAVLLLVAATLCMAAGVGAHGRATTLLLAAAMGAENAVFQRDGEVSIGLTYMTGTLVRLGQRLAAAVTGGDRWGWVPHLVLWCSLTGGVAAGAAVYGRLGLTAIWIAAALAAVLAAAAIAVGPARAAPGR